MGLFGPSKTELEDRIAELEDALDEKDRRVNDLSTRVKEAERTANRANREALAAQQDARDAREEAEEYARSALDLARVIDQHDEAGAEPLPEKEDAVETLDTPSIVWKATRNHIVKLLLPEDTTVVYPSNDSKHRADQAIVLEFYDVEVTTKRKFHGTEKQKNVSDDIALETTDTSRHSSDFEYQVGERVTPDNGELDTDTSVACTTGIHFWRTQDEALDWYRL